MIHDLKIFPEYFSAVISGRKPFEVRVNDREYNVGDILHLMEYFPGTEQYGFEDFEEVTYVLNDPSYVKEGYVVLGIKPVNEKETLRTFVEWSIKFKEEHDG